MTRGVPVQFEAVTRCFGAVRAVDGVSFELRPGEVVGLLGPNGAGKTTTMRILTGYLKADAGRVVIGGVDLGHDPVAARRSIGYLPEAAAPSAELTARGFVTFSARLHGLSGDARRRAVATALHQSGLDDVADERIRTLSKGYRQRVGLARALVHDPPVLVLDEPTTGLDPVQVTDTRNLIARLGRQRTVLMSSHLLSEVSTVCRRVLVIDRGKLVADSDIAALTTPGEGARLEIKVTGDPSAVARTLGAVAGVSSAEAHPDRVIVRGTGNDLAERVAAAVVSAGFGLVELRAEKETLEEAYLRLVRR
ncbi:MAG TPA: ABC transporter ATP-binding protein [Acidimicrobiales bacterium]